jgi:GNAT superfamily N-acetyltransferase
MDTMRLNTAEQAAALVDCAYETYGLTFHRPWLYDAEAILDLNRRGDVLSFVAMEGRQVVGHIAMIRPCFDVTQDGVGITDGAVREVGLSMVRPSHQGRGVQASISVTMMQHVLQSEIAGTYMKCVTHHTGSQKGARRSGAVPSGLLVGSVPRWIRYDGEAQDPDQPISCMQYQLSFRPRETALYVPEGFEWAWDVMDASCTPRTLAAPAPVEGETRMVVKWQGDRQLAQIYVTEAGADLADALEKKLRWLLEGHIQHVLVYLPADQPAVGVAGRELEALGLFPAGWIPDFYRGRRDALMYQASAFRGLDIGRIQVTGEDARAVVENVYGAWMRTRASRPQDLHAGTSSRIVSLDAVRQARVKAS